MAHVAKWKKDEVKSLVDMLRANPVIGVAQVDGIPSAQMQTMRKNLRADATIKIAKSTLLRIALKELEKERPGAAKLADAMNGSTALIATKMNPFKLYKRLEQSKTKAPARGGETAPSDIAVEKGETQFKPGPIVGDLQKAGIPAKIDNGKVVISANKVLVKAGEKIKPEVATMLTRLEIFPLIVGMDLKAVHENGTVFGRDVLAVDEDAILAELGAAARGALGVALEAGWATKQTIVPLIAKAQREALAVGVEAALPEKGVIDLVVAKAYREMLAVARKAPEAADDELKAALSAAPAAAAPAASSGGAKKDEEKEEEKGASEEEAMAGLGALFG
ncbi:MAG TPA: 50S ribosomal protein L10 [Candidatus Thermoplasmatota archaeon]|nr:50S ribosomal protein L10 [Candidatus Thermoplasmatota archaeon]